MPKDKTANQRMSRPNDARALRSRRALKAAVLKLVESSPLEQISIRDITNAAGVSYPVFFRRYASKEELLEDLAVEEVRNLLEYTVAMPATQLSAICEYVQEHRALWTTLLEIGAASAMRSEFTRIATAIADTRPRNNPWLPVDLAASYVASSVFEILSWWLRQPEDYPMGNVITILDVLVFRSTTQPIDVVLT